MATHDEAPRLGLGMGLTLWLAVIVVLGGFIALGTALKLTPLYAGFLFVWFWSSVDKTDIRLVPATVVGALGGIGTAWLLQYAGATYGAAGGLAVLALILVALLVQIMNWWPFAINSSYMLFLTVACAPLIQAGQDFREAVAALLLGVVYFCGVAWAGQRLFAMIRKAPAIVEPPVAAE